MQDCKGPCFPRCYKCPVHVTILAYLALTYALASVGYMILTRPLGTPFADSLTPNQRQILQDSKHNRKRTFCLSVALSLVALVVWRPIALAPSTA